MLVPNPRSLLDMLELNARPFVGAFTEMKAIQLVINGISDKSAVCVPDDVAAIAAHTERLLAEMHSVNARSAMRPAHRLKMTFADPSSWPTYENVFNVLVDVESRFADYLDDIKLFAIPDHQSGLFSDADQLMGIEDVAFTFPSIAHEVEEAAKCLAMSRPTASAFHSIRMLEVGVRALGRHLGLDDPIPADRSWGSMLKRISDEIDVQFPKKFREGNSHGAILERLYVSLDAAKNPWRNSTMHVETIYTEADASHIFNCCVVFMKQLMAVCDEFGLPLANDVSDELSLGELIAGAINDDPPDAGA